MEADYGTMFIDPIRVYVNRMRDLMCRVDKFDIGAGFGSMFGEAVSSKMGGVERHLMAIEGCSWYDLAKALPTIEMFMNNFLFSISSFLDVQNSRYYFYNMSDFDCFIFEGVVTSARAETIRIKQTILEFWKITI